MRRRFLAYCAKSITVDVMNARARVVVSGLLAAIDFAPTGPSGGLGRHATRFASSLLPARFASRSAG
jgi:hypothetical protein